MLPLEFGWRDLLFANWPVDPDALAERLPEPLAVQERDGHGWLTVVPFVNVDVRPRGLPAWLGVDLAELNLRTYVEHDGEPGVYFFSLDAAGLASVFGARLTHHLPYYYASVALRRAGDGVAVTSRRRHPGARPAHFDATYRPTGDPFEAEPGSLAEFLTERRRLYAQAQDGTIRHTDVTHPRWSLYDAEVSIEENGLFAANGFARREFESPEFESPEFDRSGVDRTESDPTDLDRTRSEPICYYSPGVDVVTTRSKRRD